MKKIILLLPILFLLSACTSNPTIGATSVATSVSTVYDAYLQIDLPQLDRNHQRLYYVDWGKLTSSTFSDVTYVLTTAQIEESLQTEVYIVAEAGEQIMMYTLGVYDKMGLDTGMLTLQDMDGDGIDEIFIHFEVAGNGATITQIYKIEDQKIVQLVDLTEFDTGYISDFQNGYKLHIQNRYTGYSVEYSIKDLFVTEFFDTNGLAISKENIELSSFTACMIIDIDNDGNYELQCDQSVSLLGYIGTVRSILQYNQDKKSFEVIQSSFIPG